MTLVRYEPWSALTKLHDEVNRLFNDSLSVSDSDGSRVVTSSWTPAVDVEEKDDRYVITADIPGVEPKDIDVTMEDGVLTIRGERSVTRESSNAEDASAKGSYKRTERSYGSFYRRFALPDNADADRINAHGNHGVLEVVIPKTEQKQARKITVNH